MSNINNRWPPAEQIFSSELIYQINNSVRSFNEHISWYAKSLLAQYFKSEDIGGFLFLQRGWPYPDKTITPWFHYMYYLFDELPFEDITDRKGNKIRARVKGIVESFDSDNFKPKWKSLINYIKNHTHSRAVEECEKWIIEGRHSLIAKGFEPSSKRFRTELQHHLLQLYSRFPMRGYMAEALYNIQSDSKNIPRQPYYVILLKEEQDEYPPLKIWGLKRDNKNSAHRTEQIDYLKDKSIDNEHRNAIRFFTEYLSPAFNEPDFDGTDFFPPKRSQINHTLWLPLYDQYIGGVCHGYFRGWLFQILPGDGSGLCSRINQEELDGKFHKRLSDYVSRCLEITNSLSIEINRAILREMLNQNSTEKKCHEILLENLCLLGGWQNIQLFPPDEVRREIDFIDVEKLSDSRRLWLNLNPDFLEHGSSDFISIDKIGEPHRILSLEFGPDFVYPQLEETEYFNRIAAQIYTIYSSLKDAKWRKIKELESHWKNIAYDVFHSIGTDLKGSIRRIESLERLVKELGLGNNLEDRFLSDLKKARSYCNRVYKDTNALLLIQKNQYGEKLSVEDLHFPEIFEELVQDILNAEGLLRIDDKDYLQYLFEIRKNSSWKEWIKCPRPYILKTYSVFQVALMDVIKNAIARMTVTYTECPLILEAECREGNSIIRIKNNRLPSDEHFFERVNSNSIEYSDAKFGISIYKAVIKACSGLVKAEPENGWTAITIMIPQLEN